MGFFSLYISPPFIGVNITSYSSNEEFEFVDDEEDKAIIIDSRKQKEIMNNSDEAYSSRYSSSSTSSPNPNTTRRVSRVAHRLKNPTVRLDMSRRSVGERQAEALDLPLGISFAAFTNLVLERSAASQNVYVDDLAMIYASVVAESLANVSQPDFV